MITLLTVLLVLVSVGLVVIIPVAVAIPGKWMNLRYFLIKAFRAWLILITLIAAADGIVASI